MATNPECFADVPFGGSCPQMLSPPVHVRKMPWTSGTPFLALFFQRPTQSAVLPCLGSTRAEAEETLLQERDLQDREEREDVEGGSQRTAEALRDLLQLAGEGMTLTQWSPAADQPVRGPGQEWVPGDAMWSSLDQSPEKKMHLGSCSLPALLASLAAAFKGMVNNPHLSDVQFQVDSGALFYAHLFVLYARCPQLMEVVDQEGFLVVEEGGAKTRRLLLSDVSGEAVGTFLNYLYTAEPFVPQCVRSEVAALATRFGVAELAALCASPHWPGLPAAAGVSGREEEEEERVEKFEELLKSVWGGEEEEEEEEDKALLPEELGSETNVVGEQELEEIYEFAATQRRSSSSSRSERDGRAGLGACPRPEPEEEKAVLGDSSRRKRTLVMEPDHLQARNARQEGAAPSFLLGPQQDAEERRPPEALQERAGALEELGEKSCLSGPRGESLKLLRQSCDGREPSNGAAGEEAAARRTPSTTWGRREGPLLASRSLSSDDSWGSLVEQADQHPASPKPRRGLCSDLSLPLFSPAPQEASVWWPGQEPPEPESLVSSRVSAGSGLDSGRSPKAPPLLISSSSSSSSAADLEGGLVGVLGAEREEEQQPVEILGLPPKEGEASGAAECHRCLGVGTPCCQGRAGPLLGTLLAGGEIDVGGKKRLLPSSSLLSPRGPKDEQVAKPGLTFDPEAPWPGGAPESLPPPHSALSPSPQKRPSPQAWPPHGHCRCPSPGSPADVVIVLDSEEEAAAPEATWGSSLLEADLLVSGRDGGHSFCLSSPEGLGATKASGCQRGSPPRPLLGRDDGAAGHRLLPRHGHAEEERGSGDGSSRRRQLGLQEQGDESEDLPLTQRLSVPVPVHKTPDLFCQEREARPPTPPTPLPHYSIMETPELKKELSRFGVRALPKKKMVRKLKEIFQYTHQRPDSKDEAAASLCCRSPKAAAPKSFPKRQPTCPELPHFSCSSGAGGEGQVAKRGCLPAGLGRLKRGGEGPVQGGQALAARQEADGLSGAARGTSVAQQSSSTEFETSVMAEEEGEEDIPASQLPCRDGDTWLVLRQFIRSRPALYRQILLYQPFELAGLQSELKQHGIKIGLARLRQFLNAHSIAYTNGGRWREKKRQRRQQQQDQDQQQQDQQSRCQGKRRRRY